MIALKQSTASQEIPLGFFVDSTDGNTEETDLTIANTDIWLWKAGATTLANKNSGGGTHISNGIYYAVLDATDTNTAGSLRIFVHKSGALAFWVDCWVFPANIYDSLFSTDLLQVDVTQLLGTAWLTPGTAGTPDVNVKLISGDATAADNCEADYDGTGYAGGTIVKGADVTKISGDATAADNLEAACDGGSYNVGGGAVVAASVTTKTGYELTAAYDAAKTAAQAGNAMTLADDAITASKFDESTAFPLKSADTGASAVARVGADSDTLETLSDQIDAVDDYIDTEVAAIKAKTDMFPVHWYNTA